MEQLLIFLVLISLGYFFGKNAEKKHYRDIIEREKKWLHQPTCSSRYVMADEREIDTSHLVSGSVVVSVDYFKRIVAGLRNVFGGNIQAYETLVDRARREAVLRMKESCPDADQVINMRLETSSISKGRGKQIGSVEVLAYGTAIYFRK